MSPRPHPTLTLALAATLLGAAPAPFAAATDEPEDTGQRCFAWGMTPEEAATGAVTEVVCYPEDEVPARRRAGISLATLYYGANAAGTSITLEDTTCNGTSYNFTGTIWDNVISSTTLLACGSAKHYTGVYSGSNQLVNTSGNVNMNATLNNQTTSIEYAP